MKQQQGQEEQDKCSKLELLKQIRNKSVDSARGILISYTDWRDVEKKYESKKNNSA